MATRFDVIVIGGGPAGIRASIAARRHGLRAVLVDEGRQPGGQVYRAPFHPVCAPDIRASKDLARGEWLRHELADSGATVLTGHRAWFASPGVRVACFGPEGPAELEADALILAAGTTERVMPVPGVTTTGVIGLAAATILLKAHGVVPPSPTVVAGVGPLLYAVAAGLLKSGGQVAAVIDLLRPAEWGAALPGLLSRPDLTARGASWMAAMIRAGVPVHQGAAVTAVHGTDRVEAVEIAKVHPDWSPRAARITIQAASLAIGHGLTPATEFSRLLRLPHRFSAASGGWIPDVAADRTAAERIYIAGDCAGISGAAAAECAGELAGLSAARDLGAVAAEAYDAASRPVRRRLARAERFGQAISRMMATRPGLIQTATPDTVICRCEDITRSMIDRVAARGARTVNQLKSTTRCGMGPCQGRSCGDPAAEIMAAQTGLSREQVGIWTARTPIRPIPLDAALGQYEYHDIPKPPMLPA